MKILLYIYLLLAASRLYADRLEEHLIFLIPDTKAEAAASERAYFAAAFEGLLKELQDEKITNKSTPQQLAYISERLQKNFQRTYVADAALADFFRKGHYNDASLAIVQALLLSELSLPYVILIDHWQAKLLADPAKTKMWLQSPQAEQTKTIEKRAFQSDYLALLQLTLLPAYQAENVQAQDSLFQQYYYAHKSPVSLEQLTAFWHYQAALQYYQQGRYETVLETLTQARQRDERPAFGALERATHLQLMKKTGQTTAENLFYLFEMWRKDPNNRYLPAALLNSFIQSSDTLLQAGASFLAAEEAYQFLYSRGEDQPAWQNQVRELYYLQKSRYYAAQNRYDLAMPYVDSLYISDPMHPVLQQVVASLSLRAIEKSGATGHALKMQLDQASNRYPFLLRHPGIRDLLLRDQAKNIRSLYDKDQGYQGDNQLAVFRTQLQPGAAQARQAIWVLEAYIAAANYYFRLGEYSEASRITQEALQYAPEDHYLLHRLEVLGKY